MVIGPLSCSKKDSATPEQNFRTSELEQIGEIYHSYLTEKKRPPTKLADVTAYGTAFSEGMKAIKEGRCHVNWGLDVSSPDAAAKVLAYEKDVPQQGGLVLMGNRTVKQMTAQEFQAAK
jgi:hypothetical protein